MVLPWQNCQHCTHQEDQERNRPWQPVRSQSNSNAHHSPKDEMTAASFLDGRKQQDQCRTRICRPEPGWNQPEERIEQVGTEYARVTVSSDGGLFAWWGWGLALTKRDKRPGSQNLDSKGQALIVPQPSSSRAGKERLRMTTH